LLENTDVTGEGVQRFQAVFPRCKIGFHGKRTFTRSPSEAQ
jgi:hypothetical protein